MLSPISLKVNTIFSKILKPKIKGSFSISSAKRAKYIAQLAGGMDSLFEQAQKSTDLQWCLELCDHLIALDYPAKDLKASVMRQLAENEINATARNTYLWEAKKILNNGNPL